MNRRSAHELNRPWNDRVPPGSVASQSNFNSSGVRNFVLRGAGLRAVGLIGDRPPTNDRAKR